MMITANITELEATARSIRRRVIQISKQSKSGHIGSSLSCVELLVGVFRTFLRLGSGVDRDRFIMSKGHACVPYYCCLEMAGLLPPEVLAKYGSEGSVLGHHPHMAPAYGIDTGSGSLGHGLSIGAGLALAGKLKQHRYRTVVLMSDGENDEGSTWEAAGFASHHRLDNLVGIVDFNKMQALGHNAEVFGLEPLHERYRAFGWGVRRVDGHDMGAVVNALAEVPFELGKPSAIIADTVKGKGISFMEDSLLWHYRCPDDTEYAAALAELGGE